MDVNKISSRDRRVPSILYSLRLLNDERERKKHVSKLSHTHTQTHAHTHRQTTEKINFRIQAAG